MIFTSPATICCSIFGFDIYYYGLIMAFAVLVGLFVSNLIRSKFYSEIKESDLFDVLFFVIIFGFIGARIYYCILNSSYYSSHLVEVFDFRQGGLSIHGGILFGLVAGYFSVLLKGLHFLKLADISSYGLVLAQSIGRWGNFFNSEAFGIPTDIFCKLYIPIQNRPLEYISFEYFHPTFLYESILDFLIFLILFFVIRKLSKNVSGIIFLSYLILYSLARITVETIRIDAIKYIYNIPFPTFISILIIILSVLLLLVRIHNNKKSL